MKDIPTIPDPLRPWGTRRWLVLAFVFLLMLAATVVLARQFGWQVNDSAAVVGTCLTGLGAVLVYLTLRDSLEWNRRCLTLQYLKDWDENTTPLLNKLRGLAPGFDRRLHAASESLWKIDGETVERYQHADASPSDKSTSQACELMYVLSDCLDTFENVAIAYEMRIVERRVIHESLARMMLNTWTFFEPAIERLKAEEGYDPWAPVTRVVSLWRSQQLLSQVYGAPPMSARSAR